MVELASASTSHRMTSARLVPTVSTSSLRKHMLSMYDAWRAKCAVNDHTSSRAV